MTDLFRVSAIDVVREGRFSWQVYTGYDGTWIRMCLNTPFWFRWRAERYARRAATRERERLLDREPVTRIELGIERELGA